MIKEHLGVGGETIEGLVEQRLGKRTASNCLKKSKPTAPNFRKWRRRRRSFDWSTKSCWKRSSRGPATCISNRKPRALVVRYRIDGMLQPQPVPPEINHFQAAIISRLKIMARLNIAEKRLPQDGRIKLKVKGREIDVRVSVIPMIHGEGIVMRILDKGAMVFDLRRLGMDETTLQDVQRTDSLAARHYAGHRADRFGQNDHAVQRA